MADRGSETSEIVAAQAPECPAAEVNRAGVGAIANHCDADCVIVEIITLYISPEVRVVARGRLHEQSASRIELVVLDLDIRDSVAVLYDRNANAT